MGLKKCVLLREGELAAAFFNGIESRRKINTRSEIKEERKLRIRKSLFFSAPSAAHDIVFVAILHSFFSPLLSAFLLFSCHLSRDAS